MQATITIFSLLLLHVYSAEIGDKCDLGFNRTGKCLVIDDCHVAINDLRNKIRPISCGFLKDKPLVCCRSPSKRFQKVRTHCFLEVQYGLQEDGSYIAAGVGGFDSLAKEFPHMSALGYGDGDDIVWGCGGTLISPDFVLTAAHCLFSRSLGSLKHVRLGDLNLKRTDDEAQPQDFAVKKTYKHPDYRPPSQYNDIALVQLDRKVQIDQFVRPACLNADPKKNETDLIATGWGQLGVGAELAEHLQKMYIQLVPETSCQNSYSKHKGSRRLPNGIIATQICAGAPKIDTCAGDSGGPLQLANSNTVYGVTSFGIACGISTAPGVYTRVSSYIDWIDSIVWPKRDNYYEAI